MKKLLRCPRRVWWLRKSRAPPSPPSEAPTRDARSRQDRAPSRRGRSQARVRPYCRGNRSGPVRQRRSVPSNHSSASPRGTAFDVTGGAAVVVAGTVKNERGEQLYAWANKPHKLECVKGADCLVFLDKSTHVDGLETTKLEWAKLDPAREDPLVAPLWGDGKTGPNGFLMKMKPGGGPFWHIHRRDYHGVVLQGTVVSYESGSQPKDMPPGSYWWQPNGNKHTTDCKGPTECIVYLDFTGPFDVKAVQ